MASETASPSLHALEHRGGTAPLIESRDTSPHDMQLAAFDFETRRPTHPPRVKCENDENVRRQAEYDVKYRHEQHSFLENHRLEKDLHRQK
jgi:hypothetical protein